MEWQWWEIVRLLTTCGIEVQLSYVTDYGIDKKSGWSFTVEGRVETQFESTAQKAVENGFRNVLKRVVECDT